MKNITFIIISFLISSCSKSFIQVFDISTTNTQLQGEYYVHENDTVKITYAFWASKGVMSFSILNKSDKPLYLDWKNSSFIYNGDKKNYWIDESHTDMASYYQGVYYNGPLLNPGYSESTGIQTSAGSTVKAERITFIPPKSSFSKSSFYLLPICYYQADNFIWNVVPRNDNLKKQTTVNSKSFSLNDSPLGFRNYLAFSFSETDSKFFFVDNEFYLSSVKEMDIRHFRGKRLGTDDQGRAIYERPFKKRTSFFIHIDLVNCPTGWNPNTK